jgi:hypothetical protein
MGKHERSQKERMQKRIMKEIPLGNGLNAKVDDEDYEWLSRYKFSCFPVYLITSIRSVFSVSSVAKNPHAKRKTGIYARLSNGL